MGQVTELFVDQVVITDSVDFERGRGPSVLPVSLSGAAVNVASSA